ncbi:hypothetical protein PMAYCL1PPCAC_25778 [Pristionchus mayeri]|uniref:Fatty-acid and retinol-binding protein 1 n=1 Tax=Pristionchus mayeri TaxID=1317129 RepID=A0AAN5D2Z0_9BILA|nr:hypothetical protein PMAYCL1PPCAC_25778 [Pristionchus mayeri]
MRLLACLFLLMAFASCRWMCRHDKIRARFGENINGTAAELIIAADAKRLGVEEEQYLEMCTVTSPQFWSEFRKADISFEMHVESYEEEVNVRFNTTDEILPFMAKHLPLWNKFLIAKQELVQGTISQLDENGKQLVYKLHDSYLNGIVQMAQLGFSTNFVFDLVKKNVIHLLEATNDKQLYVLINDLPHVSKDAFEKVFCFETASRIAKFA